MSATGWQFLAEDTVDTVVGPTEAETETVDVLVQDTIYRIPSGPLTSKSQFFEMTLRSNMVESRTGCITLADKSEVEFLEVLKFILPHSDEPKIDRYNIEFLDRWADFYMISCIKDLCEKFREYAEFEKLAKTDTHEAAEFIQGLEDEEKANKYLDTLAEDHDEVASEVRFRLLACVRDNDEGATEVIHNMDDNLAANILSSLGGNCYNFLERLTEQDTDKAASIAEQMDVDTLASAMLASVTNLEYDFSWAKSLLAAMTKPRSDTVETRMWEIRGAVGEELEVGDEEY